MRDAALALLCIVVLAILGFLGWSAWQSHNARNVAVQAQTQAGTATVSAGQAKAEADATRIVVAGERRDSLDIQVHQDNAHAILSAPGADAPVDPRLVDTADRGLCRYAVNASDPGCAGLLQPDPAQLPQAGPGGGPPP